MSDQIRVVSTTEPEPVAAPAAAKVEDKEVAKPEADAAEADTAENAATSEAQEESEEEESAEDAGEESEEKEEAKEQPKKSKNGFRKRIDKLSSRAKLAEQERDYWRQQALQAKPQETKQPTAPRAGEDDEPKQDDFDSHAAYLKAIAEHTVKKATKEVEAKQRAESAKAAVQSKISTYQKGVKDLIAKHEDALDAFEDTSDVSVSPAVQQLLIESEIGPEMSLHLARNREEFERICSMPPVHAAREFGKLEAKFLSTKTEPKEIKTTKAPAPITPVGSKGSGTVSKTIHDPNLSQAEYETLRAKQRAKQKGA